MALGNRTQQQEAIIVRIDQVDVPNQIAHAFDKTDSPMQVAFRLQAGGIEHIPSQGEKWTAMKLGHTWHLDRMLDSLDEHLWEVANLQPGDTTLTGARIYINHGLFGPTVVETFHSDPTPFTVLALAFAPVGAGQTQVFVNGLLAQESLWTLSDKTITFVPTMGYGYVNVQYQTSAAL
jgi:hypothetical protein